MVLDAESIELVRPLLPKLQERGTIIALESFLQLGFSFPDYQHRLNARALYGAAFSSQLMQEMLLSGGGSELIDLAIAERVNRFLALGLEAVHPAVESVLLPTAIDMLGVGRRDDAWRIIGHLVESFCEKSKQANMGLLTAQASRAGWWTGFRPLLVTHVENESRGIKSIYLCCPRGDELPAFRPGQYIGVEIKIPFKKVSLARLYWLSGNPRHGDYRITVCTEGNGIVSNYLNALSTGSFLNVHMPCGVTPTPGGTQCPRHFVIVVDDSGLPVAIPSLFECFALPNPPNTLLIHTMASDRQQVFGQELRHFQEKENFAYLTLRQQELTIPAARQKISDWLGTFDVNPEDAMVVLSGSARFNWLGREFFRSLGVDDKRIMCPLWRR